ncbi:pyridoxal phosphate-dependent aminotransferase [Candidatus Micrarchaeota archaeon]|nr:pyridoxal phosphate-dependent aminotransferase [Patescibacteria group bacterium]MBU1930421.1 pyridoxal phosphate-dependent aminotransferase [Candidatus Micrarchaeota archaeon]
MKKAYLRRTSSDILGAVALFCKYHDLLHKEIIKGNIRSSLDRGAFVRPQDVLSANILKLLGEERRSDSFAYGPEKGDEKLREKIAEVENIRHGTSYSINDVAMMPGAWSGLEFAIHEILKLERGNFEKKPVAVIGPTLYQMFHNPINYLGINVIGYDFVVPNTTHIPTLEDIDAIFEEKPKIIVVSNPNNPDGLYLPNNILKEMIERGRDEGGYIIVDEMQNCFPKNKGKELQYGSWIQSPNVVRVDSPSKKYALAEYRVGWVIADSNLLGDRMHGITGRMSGMMGNAARAANTALAYIMTKEIEKLESGIDFLEDVRRDLLEKEKQVLERLASNSGIKKVFSRDACINLTVQTNFHGTDIELAQKLMKKGTLIMPASGYGYRPEDAVLRITFAERNEKINHALDCLQSVLGD